MCSSNAYPSIGSLIQTHGLDYLGLGLHARVHVDFQQFVRSALGDTGSSDERKRLRANWTNNPHFDRSDAEEKFWQKELPPPPPGC